MATVTSDTLDQEPQLKYTLEQLLKVMVDKGASDVHISAGSPPLLRIDGSVHRLNLAPLTPGETRLLCYSVISEEQRATFESKHELDFSFPIPNVSRFRANLFMQRGTVAGVFRQIPFKILSFDELRLPEVVSEIAKKPRGLVLVTGPTG